MKKIFGALLLVVLGVGLSRSAQTAEPYYVSLQSAMLFSLHESARIKISNEQRNQALFSVEEAESVYYPTISLQAELGREFNDPASFDDPPASGGEHSASTNSYDFGISLQQMLFDRTKTTEIDRRESIVFAKSIEMGIVEEDVIEATLNAYLGVLSTQKTAYAAAEMLVNIRELVEKVRVNYEAGAESKARFDYVSARLSLAESKYTSALSAYQDAVNELEAQTGVLPEFLAVDPEELAVHEYDLGIYKFLAEKKNSELKLIEANIDSSRIDYEKQEASYLPRVNFVLDAGQSYDEGGEIGADRDVSAMVRIQYDLFKGFERRAAKSRINSRIRELEYEKEDMIENITKGVKANYNEIESLKQSIRIKKSETDSYLSLRQIRQEASAAGEIDLFQSIENEEQLYDALNGIYTAQSDVYLKSYNLLRLIGSLKKTKFCESC